MPATASGSTPNTLASNSIGISLSPAPYAACFRKLGLAQRENLLAKLTPDELFHRKIHPLDADAHPESAFTIPIEPHAVARYARDTLN